MATRGADLSHHLLPLEGGVARALRGALLSRAGQLLWSERKHAHHSLAVAWTRLLEAQPTSAIGILEEAVHYPRHRMARCDVWRMSEPKCIAKGMSRTIAHHTSGIRLGA
eukprot:3182700-Rhodomonas_salina.4